MQRHIKSVIFISVLLISAAFIFVSCGGKKYTEATELSSPVTVEGEYASARKCDKENLTEVYSDSYGSLYFDEETGGIGFSSAYDDMIWTSLPEFSYDSAAVLKLELINGDKRYIFDSQLSCADENGYPYEKTDRGIIVSYRMGEEGNEVVIPVEYTFSGGSFRASADMAECTLPEGSFISELSFLPCLGSVNYDYYNEDEIDYTGDYFLLPDGCGALMYTWFGEENTASLCFSVYGKERNEKTIPASAGAYGIKRRSSALACAVTEGDSISLIRAYRKNADDSNTARVYPEFIITEMSGDEGKVKYSRSYNGKITLTCTPLWGNEADRAGIAASVREIYIREGFLPDEKTGEGYPLNIRLIGSPDGSGKNALSDFTGGAELIKLLRGKGADSINLILSGFLKGGTDQKKTPSAEMNKSTGGEEALAELCSYAGTQNVSIYLGAEILNASSKDAARTVEGRKVAYDIPNPVYPGAGEEKYSHYAVKADKITDYAKKFLGNFGGFYNGGFLIEDAGNMLYSDSLSENGSFSQVSGITAKTLSAFSVHHPLMIRGCNFNVLENASCLTDVPLDITGDETDIYEAVPFIPAVLHGTIGYTGKSADMFAYPELYLLKSVEYGAAPCFTWVLDEKHDKYYEKGLSDAVDFYVRALRELSDLADERITGHYLYENGVFCTEYSGKAKVYVNYNNYSVVIGDVSVMPYDYIRLG